MITAGQVREQKLSMVDFLVIRTEYAIQKAAYVDRTSVELDFATVEFGPLIEWKERIQAAGFIVRQYESSIIGVFKFEVRW